MVDRLRALLNRPLGDDDRPRLFAIAVAVIVACAALFALWDDPAPPRARTSPPAAADLPPEPVAGPTSAADPVASPAEVARAKRAARRFLAGYLPYSYGQGPASAITGASPALRRRLTSERPRVPAQVRERHPRVKLVQTEGATAGDARLTALVSDGRRHYTVRLALARTTGGWTVTAVDG